MSEQNNTVDTMLPIPKLFAYGLQHVLAMYAGAVAVPIIIAQAILSSTIFQSFDSFVPTCCNRHYYYNYWY